MANAKKGMKIVLNINKRRACPIYLLRVVPFTANYVGDFVVVHNFVTFDCRLVITIHVYSENIELT